LSKGVYPPIFHRFRKYGIYVLRFFCQLNWVYVLIDTRLPVRRKDDSLIFARAGKDKKPREFWVSMVEKAYAKLNGCYENLISGYIDQGVQELTGFQPEKIFLKNGKTGVFPHKMIQQHYGGAEGFWNFLKTRINDNCLMGCSIAGEGKEGQLIIDDNPTGLIMNHAYGLIDAFELGEDKNGQPFRLLRMRNPWGNMEWTGRWSSESKEMKKFRDQLVDYAKSLPKDEEFDIDSKDDGMFFMAFEDWKDIFTTVFINNDFPD
jgi:hypothetical protein